jgi:hypothetical protein
MIRFGAAGTLALLSALATSACVDPQKDYEDYLARTADADTTPFTGEDSSFDGSSADGGFSNQSYVMACVSQATQDSVSDTTYFVATATFHATDSMGDGTFDFTDNALNANATDTTQTAGGAPATISGSIVTGGKVDVVFGMTTVPAPGDPLMLGPIVFTDTTLHFDIGPGTALCATLSGDVASPLPQTLVANMNICVFTPFSGSVGTVTPLTQDQVKLCP